MMIPIKKKDICCDQNFTCKKKQNMSKLQIHSLMKVSQELDLQFVPLVGLHSTDSSVFDRRSGARSLNSSSST